MKDIVIVADFCGNLGHYDYNNRFVYLADLLQKTHNVELVTGDFSHTARDYMDVDPSKYSFKLTMIHEPQYSKNVSLKRFYSHHIWGKMVCDYLKKRKTPDVVYCAVPPLSGAYGVSKYCKANDIPFVVDVQDLWPEAFSMVLKLPLVGKMAFYPLMKQADSIYRSADAIVSVSRTYLDRAVRVSNTSNLLVVFLGADLEDFQKERESNLISRQDDEIWIGYIGTLSHSYDIMTVIDALERLKLQGYNNLRFVVSGDGPYRARFEDYAKQKQITCDFLGRLPYSKMIGTICACDIAVNPIVAGSAGSIINKHGDYAAAAIAVVNSQESDEYRQLVDEYKMGLNCRCGDSADMAEKIKTLIESPSLRHEMGENSLRCASEHFDRRVTYSKIVDLINLL